MVLPGGPSQRGEMPMPKLSIVIATYNRAKHLKACLDALACQTQASAKFEVVVVVDGSTDGTVEMLGRMQVPYSLRTIWQENGGQASALNRGIQESVGQYCLFLDDDIVADPQLVFEHLKVHEQQTTAVVVGQLTLSLPPRADWYARAFARGWHEHYEQLNHDPTRLTWEDCYSGNMSAPRKELLACRGFALHLSRGYDVDLANRLEEQGCSLIYAPNALGCQYEQKSFRELSRDAERAGRTDAMLYRGQQRLTQALGSFAQGSWRKVLLRRCLLVFHVPPRLLEFLGHFIKGAARRYSLYSIIQTLCYWRGVRQNSGTRNLWRQLTSGTPVLMYHAIGSPGEPASPYILPAQRFASQMKWLKRLGYRPIPLAEFLDCQHDRRLVPQRSVVITFDDGYLDNHTYAFPVLRQHKIPATVFLVTGYIGLANEWDERKQLTHRPLMSWQQVMELMANGLQIGSHTCTHPTLTAIPASQAKEEITLSRTQLESRLGGQIDLFAYPYGKYDDSIETMVRQAGFTGACTIETGLNILITTPFSLRRTEIQGTDSLLRFVLALWTGDAEALWWHRSRNHKSSSLELKPA
jgi:peptidoglycan/xylan/chitin deacetylase (PgdA/CDA1 family)/glycosyltransferase involved in cell wall biosynthesis